jgi:LuxR family maltose regulon positive regulatory protein
MGREPPIAKLARPRLHGAVARGRLFARLDDTRESRAAICVVGPPGAGKTTLIASWLSARKLQGIWYQVDPGDADLATFFHYLGQAALAFSKSRQRPLPALTAEYLGDIPGFARRFFRELFSRLPVPAALVLDNYQEVAPDQVLHRVVTQAVEELPKHVCLIVVSRRDPPDVYARLIANEHVGFIDWDELKLTVDEVGAIGLARGVRGPEMIRALHSRSGGWAAGLVLMLERPRSDGGGVTLCESTEPLAGYFSSVVMSGVGEDTQRFLLATSMLPRITVAMAEQLTENPNAAHILEDLFRRRLFTHRGHGTATTYQYHALFREFLHDRARAVYSETEREALIDRAASVLEAAQFPLDAIALYCQAGRWESAARLMTVQAPGLLVQGRSQTIVGWIDLLPPALVDGSGALLYWRGIALASTDSGASRRSLEASFALFQQRGNTVWQLLSIAGIVSGTFFDDGLHASWVPWIEPMQRLLRQVPAWPTPAAELAVRSAFLLVTAYNRPDHPLLAANIVAMLVLIDDESLDANSRVAAATSLLSHISKVADLALSDRLIRKIHRLLQAPDISELNRGMALTFCTWCRFTLAPEYESVLPALQQIETLARENGLASIEGFVYKYLAYLHLMSGRNLAAGEAALQHLASVGLEGTSIRLVNYHASCVYLCDWRGDIQGAKRHAELCLQAAAATSIAFYIFHGAKLAHVFSNAGEHTRASALVDEIRRLIAGTGYESYEALLRLEEACIALHRGDRLSCHARLSDALKLARAEPPQALMLRWIGAPLPNWFAEALEAGIETDYVRELVVQWRVRPPAQASHTWPWPVSVDTLGRFEVSLYGKPIEFGRKAPRKILALLKALIALGGTEVSESALIDALWPDEEGDAAHGAYTMAIIRLRKLLGESEVLVQSGGKLSLDRRRCWVDAWAFGETADLGVASRAENLEADRSDEASALNLYKGSFLAGDLDAPWSAPTRERLRAKFIGLVSLQGRQLEAVHRHAAALSLYQRGLDADNLVEEFYQGLMRCYAKLDRNAEAHAVYVRLKQLLSLALGVQPSTTTQQLYRSLDESRGAPHRSPLD